MVYQLPERVSRFVAEYVTYTFYDLNEKGTLRNYRVS